MPVKFKYGGGERLSRTETVSIRLDPMLNYLCGLGARSQRRTKSSFIESAVAEKIESMELATWRDDSRPQSIAERADVLWHVRESQRLVSLGITAPDLMTYEEQKIWVLIVENGYFWRGQWLNDEWLWDAQMDRILRERVDDFWEDLREVADGEKVRSSLPKVLTNNAVEYMQTS